MYKVGVVGRRESVLGFMTLGFDVRETNSDAETDMVVQRLKKSGEYAVIFVAGSAPPAIFDEERDPSVTSVVYIPGAEGNDGSGVERLRNAARRAAGVDIILGDR